jgi:hypothetical protein
MAFSHTSSEILSSSMREEDPLEYFEDIVNIINSTSEKPYFFDISMLSFGNYHKKKDDFNVL